MFLSKVRKLKNKEEGATAVEFALLSPVFFLLLLGLLEFSLIMFKIVVSENSVREVARQAIATPTDEATLQAQIIDKTFNLFNFNDPETCVIICAYADIDELNSARALPQPTCGANICPGNSVSSTQPEALVRYRFLFRHTYITPIGEMASGVLQEDGGNFIDLSASTVVTNEPFN